MPERYDVVVIGAGTAGIPCAVEAARGGARVLLVEKDERIGGTLHTTGGHMSAAGTRRQQARGIGDSVDLHIADIERISGGTARPDLVRAVASRAPGLIDWLEDNGFQFAPETPRLVFGHEPYSVPRTYYGKDAGLSILEVFARLLEEAVAAGGVEVWRNSPAIGLIPDGAGVGGATVLRGGAQEVAVQAGAVVLATGGFAADPELFQEIEGMPLVSAAHPTSTGDGLVIARELGVAIAGRGQYLPSFGGLPHPTAPGRVWFADRPLLVAAERPPWEIYVDRSGRRFIAEDEPSIDAKERALAALADGTFWTIFDDTARQRSVPMVAGWSPEDLLAKANHRVGVVCADTLADLARRAGIDPDGLASTVSRYNPAVEAGADPEFGRQHLPATIATPPFFAIENHGITLVTFAGIDVDSELRVRREDGSIVERLYAIGEILGAAATCGNSFCGGMLVTPALVFGQMVGERLRATRVSAPG